MMEVVRRAFSDPPELRTFRDDKPALLFSWWSTIYSIVIILLRVSGRYVRTERMFAEEGSMLLAILPLIARMGFVHVVLLYGTNNTTLEGLTSEDIRRREIGSRFVLASRIMYVTYLWTVKYSVSMFLRTLTEQVWRSFHQRLLRYLHIVLAATYIGSVISILAECQPIYKYWQVDPDPGPQCRQGSAALFTAGTLNIVTNLILVLFPIPVVLKARLPLKGKLLIVIRLGLPLMSAGFTCYQIPRVRVLHYMQGVRSMLASFDILIVTLVSNAIVLLSLLHDRGYKKKKYKPEHTQTDLGAKTNLEMQRQISNHLTMKAMWGSDEHLVAIDEQDSDDRSESIRMETLKAGKKARPSQDKRSTDFLSEPQRVKLQDIRIASTWEVSITQK